MLFGVQLNDFEYVRSTRRLATCKNLLTEMYLSGLQHFTKRFSKLDLRHIGIYLFGHLTN